LLPFGYPTFYSRSPLPFVTFGFGSAVTLVARLVWLRVGSLCGSLFLVRRFRLRWFIWFVYYLVGSPLRWFQFICCSVSCLLVSFVRSTRTRFAAFAFAFTLRTTLPLFLRCGCSLRFTTGLLDITVHTRLFTRLRGSHHAFTSFHVPVTFTVRLRFGSFGLVPPFTFAVRLRFRPTFTRCVAFTVGIVLGSSFVDLFRSPRCWLFILVLCCTTTHIHLHTVHVPLHLFMLPTTFISVLRILVHVVRFATFGSGFRCCCCLCTFTVYLYRVCCH